MRTRDCIREARRRGKEAGKSAASWIVDNSTTIEQAKSLLESEPWDIEPRWLSGEWSGESISELLGDLLEDCETKQEEILGVYEESASRAFWQTVWKDAKAILPKPLSKKALEQRYTHPQFKGVALFIVGQSRDGVEVCMVGDDRYFTVDFNELTALKPLDYCSECGQIGCGHDGRDRR